MNETTSHQFSQYNQCTGDFSWFRLLNAFPRLDPGLGYELCVPASKGVILLASCLCLHTFTHVWILPWRSCLGLSCANAISTRCVGDSRQLSPHGSLHVVLGVKLPPGSLQLRCLLTFSVVFTKPVPSFERRSVSLRSGAGREASYPFIVALERKGM